MSSGPWNTGVDFEAISAKFKELGPAYREGNPFPHISVHGLFREEILRQISSEFPIPKHSSEGVIGEVEGGKYTKADWTAFGPSTQAFVAACSSGKFVSAHRPHGY